jgi:5-methyltetrahydropteroyltriglutamate--homocysteine methyltransferase
MEARVNKARQGFVLQIDDPGLPDWWEMLKPEPAGEEYRKFARPRIVAVNHALAGIPEESVRYHLCWGSWHGPQPMICRLSTSSI